MKSVLRAILTLCILVSVGCGFAFAQETPVVQKFTTASEVMNQDVGRGIQISSFPDDGFSGPAIKAVFTDTGTAVGQGIRDNLSQLSVWSPDEDSYIISLTDTGHFYTDGIDITPNGKAVCNATVLEIDVITYSDRTEIVFPTLGMKAVQNDDHPGAEISCLDNDAMTAVTSAAPEYQTTITTSATHILSFDP